MQFNDNILYNWYKQFDPGLLGPALVTKVFDELKLKDEFDPLLNDYILKSLSRYNLSSEYKVSVDNCATNIIDYLFDKYVDEDTLVITTNCEHPSVVKNLAQKCFHKFYISNDLRIYNERLQFLDEEIEKYKKVFVYINTAPIISKIFIPDSLIKRIRNSLILADVQYHIVLDEVQGMHFIHRDYSLADSIVSTAHAFLNKKFNMGILISKSDYRFFDKYGLMNYLMLTDLVFKYKYLINEFAMVMTHYYSGLIGDRHFELFNQLPYKFFIIDKIASDNLGKIVPLDPKSYDKEELELFEQMKKIDPSMIFSSNAIVRGVHALWNYEKFIAGVHDVNKQIQQKMVD